MTLLMLFVDDYDYVVVDDNDDNDDDDNIDSDNKDDYNGSTYITNVSLH